MKPEKRLRRFVAVTFNMPVISVGAYDEVEAKKEIIDQLNRPGRYWELIRWQESGEVIIERKGAWND